MMQSPVVSPQSSVALIFTGDWQLATSNSRQEARHG